MATSSSGDLQPPANENGVAKPPLHGLLDRARGFSGGDFSDPGGRRYPAALRVSLERFHDENRAGPRQREGEDRNAREKREARRLDGRGPRATGATAHTLYVSRRFSRGGGAPIRIPGLDDRTLQRPHGR